MGAERVLDGRYRLLREIAAGGMGVVHEAEHLALRKRVAVKLLRREIADLPAVATRFEREARATSLLDDPHVVRVTDFGRTAEGELYLVMELLEGSSLGVVLAATPRLATQRAVGIADQILRGLEAAHAAGLIHRDLKPDNVFVTTTAQGEHVRLLDFGIAAARLDGTKLTVAGAVMGTAAYMAPEQAMGLIDLDARTDLYAVGAILYEMLAGRPAYGGDNYNQILHAVVEGMRPPLETLRSDAPSSLCAIIERAMAPEKADRYASASELRSALRSAHEPLFRMPDRLEVTDLRGPDSASSPPSHDHVWGERPRGERRPSTSPPPPAVFAAEDVVALELDRPPPAAPPPVVAQKRFPTSIVLGLVGMALAGAGYFAWTTSMAPKDASVLLVNVPPDAQLVLDGTPIVGRRLVLPISNQPHELRLERGRKPPRVYKFAASADRTIDVAAELR